jgi:hypothetical protein
VLVAALAATVPATAVGVGVKTVLAPTASGPPAAGRPARADRGGRRSADDHRQG